MGNNALNLLNKEKNMKKVIMAVLIVLVVVIVSSLEARGDDWQVPKLQPNHLFESPVYQMKLTKEKKQGGFLHAGAKPWISVSFDNGYAWIYIRYQDIKKKQNLVQQIKLYAESKIEFRDQNFSVYLLTFKKGILNVKYSETIETATYRRKLSGSAYVEMFFQPVEKVAKNYWDLETEFLYQKMREEAHQRFVEETEKKFWNGTDSAVLLLE